VLNAGSLQARLSPEPISEITVAPELGADNLRQGLHAGVVALIVIGLFMIVYYYVYGVVAVVCLLANAVCIVGAMALARASFTLPGIAGVILTFGMAVDANVLIFERVREELRKGLDLRVAMKLGFGKALSSIVDGNVTNLIVCFVLGYMGTQEIRGFAITLGIGVVSTLFSALVLSRVIFVLLIDIMKIKHMGMLPMTLPVIDRILEPRVNWLRLRYFFIPLSIGVVGLGLAMIALRGEKMLDAEFRGGTAVTLELARQNADDPASPRRTATRAEVEERVHAIGEGLAENDPLRPLRAADVVPVNPEDDGVTSDRFIVRTYATESELVLTALVERLDTLIDALPALSFRGQDAPSAAVAPAYPVVAPRLGDSVGRPEWRDDVSDYLGGVAIVLENIEPRPRLSDLVARLDQMRTQPDYSNTLGRRHEVRVLAGSTDAVESAVVLVRDEGVSAFDSEAVWNADVRDREWSLAQQALTEPIVRASVQNFSPAIADTFRQQAIVAVGLSVLMIVLYIWVRFGGARYSLAAIATLTHDVVAMIGLIAFAEILYDSPKLAAIAQSIGIQPFKIDLNLVAAILTIIGYSLNDTIIIMDRIRENRGKLPFISARVINESINQTISRTIITSGTTLLAVVILYVDGGMGVRAFSYALLCGILVGTYSSIAVSAPLVWSRKRDLSARAEAAAHEGEAATKA
jgi:SecD/SecF fusion protein